MTSSGGDTRETLTIAAGNSHIASTRANKNCAGALSDTRLRGTSCRGARFFIEW